jgi:hypothetical protein
LKFGNERISPAILELVNLLPRETVLSLEIAELTQLTVGLKNEYMYCTDGMGQVFFTSRAGGFEP